MQGKLTGLLVLFIVCAVESQNVCNNLQKCAECIQTENCQWCSKPVSENMNHCFDPNTPITCDEEVIAPKSTINIITNKPIQLTGDKTVQMSPQNIQITMRKGETFIVPFQFAQANNVPMDLYYIMDLSASMEQQRETLAKLGLELHKTMKSFTSDFKLGFGSFVDKTDKPFISIEPLKLERPCLKETLNCVKAYSFKNHLKLTENGYAFAKQVQQANVSRNLDTPEGGFDALMQAMVCKDEIGWRNTSRRIIVFSTDAIFHIAGDGKLAGVVEPNDAKCHMFNNQYTADLKYDYPSISHINFIAKQNSINIFFAIVDKVASTYVTYEKLKNEIENSGVARLNENANKNIVKLIQEYYNKISNVVSMTPDFYDDENIHITYKSDCNETINICDVHVGKLVNFNASIKVDQCHPNTDNLYKFRISPQGYSDGMEVELKVICECDCENEEFNGFKKNDASCSNAGDLVCGVCECHSGFSGKNCECNDQSNSQNNNENSDSCKIGNNTICSGFGTCKCGQCECQTRPSPNEHITGKYCECADYTCPQENNILCNGHGRCECGLCKCNLDYSGSSCECKSTQEACTVDRQICSNNGECVCGDCRCNVGFYGDYCEESAGGEGKKCDILKPCVECTVFDYGEYKNDCEVRCQEYDTKTIDDIDTATQPNVYTCSVDGKDDCRLVFQYYYNEDSTIMIESPKELQCSISVLSLVIGLIGSILLAGIIMLVIWKVVTSIHDKREYDKFENERENNKWNRNDNPLFRTPITKFENPTFRLNRLSSKSNKIHL